MGRDGLDTAGTLLRPERTLSGQRPRPPLQDTLMLTPHPDSHHLVNMKPQLLPFSLGSLGALSVAAAFDHAGIQEPLRAPIDPTKYRAACPDYKSYSMRQQYSRPPGRLPRPPLTGPQPALQRRSPGASSPAALAVLPHL
jgi:hypothetical protein